MLTPLPKSFTTTYTNSGQFRQIFHRPSVSSPHLHRSSQRETHSSPHLHRSSHQANLPSPHNHHSADHSCSTPHPNSPAFLLSSPDHRTHNSTIPQTSAPPQEPIISTYRQHRRPDPQKGDSRPYRGRRESEKSAAKSGVRNRPPLREIPTILRKGEGHLGQE